MSDSQRQYSDLIAAKLRLSGLELPQWGGLQNAQQMPQFDIAPPSLMGQAPPMLGAPQAFGGKPIPPQVQDAPPPMPFQPLQSAPDQLGLGGDGMAIPDFPMTQPTLAPWVASGKSAPTPIAPSISTPPTPQAIVTTAPPQSVPEATPSLSSLIGNDGLRQQMAGKPEMLPWLDAREAHILGADQPTADVGSSLPPQVQDVEPYQPLPQAPMLPSAPVAPPQGISEPPPYQPPPIAPMLPASPAGPPTTGFPSEAPLSLPQTPVTMPQRTFQQAYQPPALPTFSATGLAPNLGAYRPAPSMPGYALPRTGNPFRASEMSSTTPQDFSNPFGALSTQQGASQGASQGFQPGPQQGAQNTQANSLFGYTTDPATGLPYDPAAYGFYNDYTGYY